MRFRAAWIIALMLCLIPGYALAQEKGNPEISVTAEGVAALSDNDPGKAEDEALTDAKRNAVEQAVGVFVKADAMGKDFGETVEERILTHSEGYITRWEKVPNSRKVDSLKGGGRLLRVKIRATVSLLKLVSDASQIEPIYNAMQRPRVMVLMNEQNAGNASANSAAAQGIARALQELKFDVVDPEISAKIRQRESTRASVDNDPKAAAMIALQEGAEILVLGSASAAKMNLDESLDNSVKISRARVSARIVYSDTGEVLFTPKAAEAGGTDFGSVEQAGEKALDTAGSQLIAADGPRFAAQVIARWAGEIQNGRVVRISARNLSYAEFGALKKALRGFRGFVEMVRESYQSRTATLDMKIKLNPDQLRDRLEGLKLGSKKASVEDAFGSTTVVTFH